MSAIILPKQPPVTDLELFIPFKTPFPLAAKVYLPLLYFNHRRFQVVRMRVRALLK